MVPVVLPDRYVEGTCPACSEDGARGDQCDACGATYEAVELKNPVSKMNPDANVEIRETDHLFYRLDLFQAALETHAQQQQSVWKANVKAMTKQWLDMGLRPRAVTRDLSWGIPVPLDGGEWDGKCIYVWFEAVQGYSTCARIWSQNHASELPDGERHGNAGGASTKTERIRGTSISSGKTTFVYTVIWRHLSWE